MVFQLPGGVFFPPRTDAWKHRYTLPDAGRVYLGLPSDGGYRLSVELSEPVRIGSEIAVLEDGSPVYATVSGSFDGLFSLHGQIYAGLTDNTQRMAIPVRAPETRPIGDISPEEMVAAIRTLGVYDTRRNDYLWRSISGKNGSVRRILVDLTDAVSASFTNYSFAMDSAESVLNGAKILCSFLGASKIVLITDVSRKGLKKKLSSLVKDDPVFSIAEVAARYPVCDASLLSAIYNIPFGKKAEDIFIISGQSSAALYAGLATGFAHTEHILSVSGSGFGKPCVLRIPIGTTWKAVLKFCQFKGGAYKTKVNSPLTGMPATGICRVDQEYLTADVERVLPAEECISCGRCASVCPSGLFPFRILTERNYMHVKSTAAACIRCGCCSYACPSNIPLATLIQKYAERKEKEHV